MVAGIQANAARIDEDITNIALALRAACTQARNLNVQVNGAGNGQAYLAGIGHTDPTTALQYIGYLENMASLYFGLVNLPASFNFDSGLAPSWGGIVS